jgi:para-nitrobenzyl esterase
MPPEKPVAWTNIRNCLQYGPACPQPAGRFDDLNQFFFEFNRGYMDEDCLSLNVWTPGVNDQARRPVLFWLHGGGFATGSSFELPSYDGRNLARRGDVVVVSINHRLNAFGHLHLAGVSSRYADSVNVGMLDIVAALAWVRDNIAGFGGDPGNVTIFGQSGGGAKVHFLLRMPSAKGLFHKAIAQSTTPMTSNRRTLEFSVRHTEETLSALGLTPARVNELQNIPAETLRAAFEITSFAVEFEQDALIRWDRLSAAEVRRIPFDVRQPPQAALTGLVGLLRTRYGWDTSRVEQEVARFAARSYSNNMGPAVDGRVVLEATNPSSQVPMIIGHTLNEGGGPNFFNSARESWTDADLQRELARRPIPLPAGVVEGLRNAYPNAKPVEIYAHTVNQGGLGYRIDSIRAAAQAVENRASAYLYTFAWKTSVMEGRPRAFHRSEIPFVFDNTDLCAHQTGGTSAARTMAGRVADAWIAFARTGNPNHGGIPNWAAFDSQRVPTMFFDDEPVVRYDHDRVAREAFAAAF